MNVCIFCSANDNISSQFFDCTEALCRYLAREGHTIVFGGCDMGLMACIARSASEAGGRTVGVVPRIVEDGGGQSPLLTEVVPCRDLNERKALMMEMSDVFVVLPGGIGTLDEVFTVAASATIGYHHKPILLYNIDGFWDSLVYLLEDLEERGMMRGGWRRHIKCVDSLDEMARLLG